MIEYDLSDGKIYAYSAADYIDNLSSRTRDDTLKRYRDAIKNNEFMFFVKDTKRRRRLCSYIYPLPDLSEIISVKKVKKIKKGETDSESDRRPAGHHPEQVSDVRVGVTKYQAEISLHWRRSVD